MSSAVTQTIRAFSVTGCLRTFLSGLILLTLLPAPSIADEEKAPAIGDIGPAWKDLKGTDGKLHSLSDLATTEVLVVCFTCNTCPYAIDYEQRLMDLQKKYADAQASVQLIAINSNTISADRLEAMQQRANERKFNFPYLSDETQQVARAYGAVFTPEFFVLNKERKIVYKGAMDDQTDPVKVKHNYVDMAVAAALSNQSPQISETAARGCAIRFKRQRR